MKIQIATGTLDCHFEENQKIAIANMMAGRSPFADWMMPTYVPDPRWPDQEYVTVEVPDSAHAEQMARDIADYGR